MPDKQRLATTSERMSAWHRRAPPACRKPQNHSANRTAPFRAGSMSITGTVRGMKNPPQASVTDMLTNPRGCAGIKMARPITQHARRGRVAEMTGKMTARIARLSKPDRNHRSRRGQNEQPGGGNPTGTIGTIGTTGRRWRIDRIARETRAMHAARRQNTAFRPATRQTPTWPPHPHGPPDPFRSTRPPHTETVVTAKKVGAEISANRKARRNACTNCSPKAAWARAAKWKNGLPPAA